MYNYTRSYEGLGQQAYTRSYDGLGKSPYVRQYDGLGWLNSPGAADQIAGGRNVCFRTDEQQFASNRGCRPAYGMGCRQADGRVSQYPCCPSDQTKTLWECPSDWETRTSGSGGRTAGRSEVRALQQAIQGGGCNPGPIDGLWGPRTESGLRCYASQTSWANISRSFPWAAARMGQTTTPGSGGGGGDDEPTSERQAGILPFPMPGVLGEWWFWIAALGIGGLGVAGALQLRKKKEEQEFTEIGGY